MEKRNYVTSLRTPGGESEVSHLMKEAEAFDDVIDCAMGELSVRASGEDEKSDMDLVRTSGKLL